MIDKNFTLQSKKVVIRQFREEDITKEYLSWLNDKKLMQYSNQRFLNHNLKTSLNYLNGFKNTNNNFFAIINRDNKKLIGTMTSYFFKEHKTVDVGILIGDKSISGQGYGKESWKLYLDYLSVQKNIRKITAGTVACNISMLKLIEFSDMVPDGKRKNHEIVNNKLYDVLYFAKYIN